MFAFLFELQRDIRTSFTSDIIAYANTHDFVALLAVLPLGIVFGAIHALTPGHSKSVLAAYVAGSGLKPWRALIVSFVLSLTHVSLAVLLALVTNSLVKHTIVGAGRAPTIEWVSRLTLVAIGIWLIFRAAKASPHFHGEGITAGVLAGLIPCPLTLFVMLLAVARGVPEAGLVFAVAMLGGVALVLGFVAVLASFARGWLVDLINRRGVAVSFMARVFDGLAGTILVVIAIHELSML